MKRIRAVGAVLVAVAAVCAVAASSAAAKSPLWLTAAGALKTGESLLFTATKESGTGNFKLESNGATIECSGVESHGHLVGGMPGTVLFLQQPTFTHCTENGAPEPGCVVKGLNATHAGEVEINATSRLVYINSGETEVGELFEGAGSSGEFVTLYLSGGSCLTSKTPEGPTQVRGSVIGEIDPPAGNMVAMTGLLLFPKPAEKKLFINGGHELTVSLKAFGTGTATEVGDEEVLADGEWGVLTE